jgi:rfaE bifunctional protein nucleotidyltransferase chain/domain
MLRAADKIVARDQLAKRVPALRSERGKIVFTCGVFDLLHVGHVRYLEFARALGGALVVGVNSDASARGLNKSPSRPLVPDRDRAEVVAALGCVDFVVVFDELRPNETILALKPDIHVKSAAYANQELPEAVAVAQVGGEIVFAPHVEGRSTTAIVERAAASRTQS